MVTPTRPTGRRVGDSAAATDLARPEWNVPVRRAPNPADKVDPVPKEVAPSPRILQGFGLTDHEARVYVAVLSRGSSNARGAIQDSGLQRATAYRVLSRLVARGLVTVRPRWPREYSAVDLRTLISRQVSFLRDEIELHQWLLRALPGEAGPTHDGGPGVVHQAPRSPDGSPPPLRPSVDLRVAPLGGVSDSPLLERIQGTRHDLVAFVRPLLLPARLRARVAAALLQASSRGVRVRIVLDYQAADHRFASAVEQEILPRRAGPEVRHYTPLAGHGYVFDESSAIRFLVLSRRSKDPDFGLLSEESGFVHSQLSRFESIWEEAVAPAEDEDARRPESVHAAPFPASPNLTGRPRIGEVRPFAVGGTLGRPASRS